MLIQAIFVAAALGAGGVQELQWAVQARDLSWAERLIDEGRSPRGALRPAVAGCDLPMVELLLSAGAHVDASTAQVARLRCGAPLVEALVHLDAQAGVELLVEASAAGDEAAVRALLGLGVSPQAVRGDGLSALDGAVRGQHDALAQLLLRRGAVPGERSLALVGKTGNEALLGALLSAWPGRRAQAKEAVLVGAAQAGELALMEALVAQKVDLEGGLEAGGPPLAAASQRGSMPGVRLLLGAGAGVNTPREDGRTPLMLAASSPEVVAALLEAGAEVNGASPRGETPLMVAARRPARGSGGAEVVRLLLEAGARVDQQVRGTGETALMVAVRARHLEAVALLVQAGADLEREAQVLGRRYRPLELAAAGGDPEVVAALLAAGPVPDPAPMEVAAEAGHLAVVEALLAAGFPKGAAQGRAEAAGHEAVAALLRD